MSATVDISRAAAQQANGWLADADIEARFTGSHVDGQLVTTCAMLVAHPLADDISVRVTGTAPGANRDAALADARAQLGAFVQRTFTDPDRAMAQARTAREAYLYAQTPRGMHRVANAVAARGCERPTHSEIRMAVLRLKVMRGHEDHTIGDLVGEVLTSRAKLNDGAGVHPDQAALSV